METHYRRPGWFTQRVFNPIVAGLTKTGLSVKGSRVLEVRGRKTGQPRKVPVNLLEHFDELYLVAPRGETDWVRNVRAADGRLSLILGRRRQEMIATELDDSEKVPILREYLRRWKSEVGMFFDGVGPDSSDTEIAAIANKHPVFRLAHT
ncbi:MAG TPA: nitroreductase family deazaflavin-dependent oxidoreductase [Acidimicrobiales bacterium]|nr:nitroreductase family deazaflavin-dependent oxidoreductase [Acidimicrobiales bacterium]